MPSFLSTEGKPFEEDCVRHGEDRGVHADADGQGSDRCEAEPRAATQGANGKADVLYDAVEPRQPACIAVGFFGRLDSSEVDQGLAVSFWRGHSLPNMLFSRQFDVGCQFFVEVLVELLLTKERDQACPSLAEYGH